MDIAGHDLANHPTLDLDLQNQQTLLATMTALWSLLDRCVDYSACLVDKYIAIYAYATRFC